MFDFGTSKKSEEELEEARKLEAEFLLEQGLIDLDMAEVLLGQPLNDELLEKYNLKKAQSDSDTIDQLGEKNMVQLNVNETDVQAQNISPELRELQNKLAILFEYERNYLTLLRDFKDEIKFAYELQQNLRKERAKFFSETLRDVSATLAQAQVDESIASMWVQDLVKSYTSSLDLSANLVDENTMNTIGQIRASVKGHASDVSLNTQQNELS